MKFWQEDVTNLFEATGISVSKPLVVGFNEATYEYSLLPKANWLFYAFLAFLKLALEIKRPDLVATVGVGSGLDGIALYQTLNPKRLRMIDVNPEVIGVAKKNLEEYFRRVGATVHWSVELGNLCGPLTPNSADLIYANVPTIPGPSAEILVGMNSSSFFDSLWVKDPPQSLARNYLALQYEFLRQAHRSLKAQGSVLLALGVRVPALVVDELFAAAGFHGFEPVVLDLKEQSQPEAVVASYARQEHESGIEFDFYKADALQHNTNFELSLSDYKQSLATSRISATTALELTQAGQKVYHVIAMLRAKK